jgi:hypothetical protein
MTAQKSPEALAAPRAVENFHSSNSHDGHSESELQAQEIVDWLVRISTDGRIPSYGFRFALRLASKIKGADLQARIKKFQPTADLDAAVALTAAGYLAEFESGELHDGGGADRGHRRSSRRDIPHARGGGRDRVDAGAGGAGASELPEQGRSSGIASGITGNSVETQSVGQGAETLAIKRKPIKNPHKSEIGGGKSRKMSRTFAGCSARSAAAHRPAEVAPRIIAQISASWRIAESPDRKEWLLERETSSNIWRSRGRARTRFGLLNIVKLYVGGEFDPAMLAILNELPGHIDWGWPQTRRRKKTNPESGG